MDGDGISVNGVSSTVGQGEGDGLSGSEVDVLAEGNSDERQFRAVLGVWMAGLTQVYEVAVTPEAMVSRTYSRRAYFH